LIRSFHLTALLVCVIAQTLPQALGWRAVTLKFKNQQFSGHPRRDIYFFGDSSARSVNSGVVLRGKKKLRIWNPHTGMGEVARFKAGSETTDVQLVLGPVSSLFYVSERK
jgi:hypothetical protein